MPNRTAAICCLCGSTNKKTGKAPDPSQVISATSRSGKRKDVVKVYDHEDSSSWSFSETEATTVGMKRELDSGKVMLKEGQARDQFAAAVAAQEGAARKSSRVTLAGLRALEAENKGAAPAATRASQLAPAAPALSALDAAMAAQEARDRIAEGKETLSRAKALLHPAGVGQAKAKPKPNPKGARSTPRRPVP